jgi:ATP-dependent Clp protease ATP-binding subunit ClpC
MKSGYTLSIQTRQVIESAEELARHYNSTYVTSQHILCCLLRVHEQDVVIQILLDYGIDANQIANGIESSMKKVEFSTPPGQAQRPDVMYSPKIKEIITASAVEASQMGTRQVDLVHLLLGILSKETGLATLILSECNVSVSELRSKVRDYVMPHGDNTSDDMSRHLDDEPSATRSLDKYCKDLTKLARAGKLPIIIGRERELDRTIQTLMRKMKNNPVILGDPGIGKTAIIESLAQQIADGNVPNSLKTKKILSLDLPLMLAGTKYRGQFEERLTDVLHEINDDPDVIIFLDELHMMVGAGGGESAMDASNILKPALSRGELTMIGATTVEEYRKHIEPDGALERRFQPLYVDEPTITQVRDIMLGVKVSYERFHNISVDEDCIDVMIKHCERYLSDRSFPDKSIDLLDETCSKIKLSLFKKYKTNPEYIDNAHEAEQMKIKMVTSKQFDKAMEYREQERKWLKKIDNRISMYEKKRHETIAMTKQDIDEVISRMTGIPISSIKAGDNSRLLKLERNLKKNVIGQDDAIQAIVSSIKRSKSGLNNPSRPIGSFLFLGPTGVGKTHLTKCLSESLFDTEEAIIRVDMSEMMEGHSVSKLVGSPPGYVGFDEGGGLTERVKRQPYSVVLFDEIEKAHPDVLNILLQILDEGHVTDSHGRNINFKNTIVVLTSNIGADKIVKDTNVGFMASDSSNDYDKTMKEVHALLRPEFINRLDEIVVFNRLDREHLLKVSRLIIKETQERVLLSDRQLSVSSSIFSYIVDQNEEKQFGARAIRRLIRKKIDDIVSDFILTNPECVHMQLKMRNNQPVVIEKVVQEPCPSV